MTESYGRGTIFLVHGFAEHVGRYEELAARLNEAQFSVFGLSHQGHGKSGGDRVHVKSFQSYTEDLLSFVEAIRKERPSESGVPRYLLGHSMGGAIALQTVQARPDMVGC